MTPERPGIIAALRSEMQVLEADGKASRMLRAQSGPGPVRAEVAGERLLTLGADALLSWGCAGALHPDRRPGELIIPEQLIAGDGDTLLASIQWREWLLGRLECAVFSGPITESDTPLTEVASKHDLYLHTGACAVDMESVALARVARRHDVPFLALRAVADRADQALPRRSAALIKADGSLRASAIGRALATGPGEWRRLRQAAKGFNRALATLRQARRNNIFPA